MQRQVQSIALKTHIDAIRKAGIRDLVKLMKLWRLRRGLAWSTFALEIAVAQALQGRWKMDYAACLRVVFAFLVTNVMLMRFVDPANSNNMVEVSATERVAIWTSAAAASRVATLSEVFR